MAHLQQSESLRAPRRLAEQVSNDPPSFSQIAEAVQGNNFQTVYSCERMADESLYLNTVKVFFDYEYIGSLKDKDITSVFLPPPTLPAVEWGTLWTVADNLALHGCHLDEQDFEEPTKIVLLSSFEVDELDTSVATCQFLGKNLPPETKCYPVRGVMTAKYSGDDEQVVTDYLLSRIEYNMNEQQILNGGVKQALFLGVRDEYTPEGGGNNTSGVEREPENDNPSSGVVALASSLSVAAVVGFFIAGLLLARKKKKEPSSSSNDKVVVEQPTDVLDLAESASTPPQEEITVEPASSPKSLVSVEHSVASATTLLVANLAPKPQPHMDDQSVETSESASSDAAVRVTESTTKSNNIVDALPPLPPNGPSKQPPQQPKRRRKKKKKKKTSINRVNSKDGINEMETINEAEGEEDDGNVSDGSSEYSWSTDDSGSRSRDPLPVRSSDGDSSSTGSPMAVFRSKSQDTP